MNRIQLYLSIATLIACSSCRKDNSSEEPISLLTAWDELAGIREGSDVKVQGYLDPYWHDETTSFTVLREFNYALGEERRHVGVSLSFDIVPESVRSKFVVSGRFSPSDSSEGERVGAIDVSAIEIVSYEPEELDKLMGR